MRFRLRFKKVASVCGRDAVVHLGKSWKAGLSGESSLESILSASSRELLDSSKSLGADMAEGFQKARQVEASCSETSKRHLKRQLPQSDAKSDSNFAAIGQFLTCHFTVVAFRGRCTIVQKSSFHGC